MTLEDRGPGPDALYREELLAGRFTVQTCADCGQSSFPPRVFCKHCGSANLERVEASGHGVVYATSAVRNRPDKGGDHNVSLVDWPKGAAADPRRRRGPDRGADRRPGEGPDRRRRGAARRVRLVQE